MPVGASGFVAWIDLTITFAWMTGCTARATCTGCTDCAAARPRRSASASRDGRVLRPGGGEQVAAPFDGQIYLSRYALRVTADPPEKASPSWKRGPDPGYHHGAVPPGRGQRVSRGASRASALLHVNEPRRPRGHVASRADACVRQARGEPHLHVVRPASGAVVRRVVDVGVEYGPAHRRGRRSRLDVRCERMERGWRGGDTVAQEHVRRACGVSVELDVPRERVVRVDVLECHLEDRLRCMSHVGRQVGTARLFAGRERRVLVPVGPRDEEGAGPQGQICFDRFVGRLEVVLGVRRREAQGPLRMRIEDRYPSLGALDPRDR